MKKIRSGHRLINKKSFTSASIQVLIKKYHFLHCLATFRNFIDKSGFSHKKGADEDFSALFCLTPATPAEIAKLQLF